MAVGAQAPDVVRRHTQVSLHAAACTQIEYSPIALAVRLSFHLNGLGESTAAATGAELVVTSDNARTISWDHDDTTANGERAPWHGQVTDMHRTGRIFVPTLLDLEVAFEATTVTANIR